MPRGIAAQELVEEAFVPVLELGEVDVALEVVRAHGELPERTRDLRAARLDLLGEEPLEPERLALFGGEGGALVEALIVEKRVGVGVHVVGSGEVVPGPAG